MAVNINASGTSFESFQIAGPTGTGSTIWQAATQPAGMAEGDIWIDTTLGSVKVFKGGSTETLRIGDIEITGNTITTSQNDLILNSSTGNARIGTEYIVTSTTSTPVGGWTTDEIPEGATNLYHTDARSRSSISSTSTGLGSISYTPATGVIAYTGPSTINLGTDTTGNYVATLAPGAGTPGIVVTNGTGESSATTIALDSDVVRTLNTVQTIQGTKTFNDARGIADPTQALGFATKQYVDNISTGLDTKQSVRAATTASITLSGAQTIDNVSVIAGDRVLVKDQGSAANGIYDVAAGAWTRSADADNSPTGEVTSGMYTFVEEGTINGNGGFVLQTADPITLGSTILNFVQFSGAGQVVAGDGLSKNVNTLSVNTGNGITTSADNVVIDTAIVVDRANPQSLAGQKTFTSPIIINTGTSTGLQINKSSGGTANVIDFDSNATFGVDGSAVAYWTNGATTMALGAGNTATIGGNRILTVADEGTGNGLDADTLDGQEGTYYNALSNATGTLAGARFTDSSHGSRSGGTLHANAVASGAAGFMSGTDKALLDSYDIPAIISNGTTPSLNAGITDAELRSLLTLGTLATQSGTFVGTHSGTTSSTNGNNTGDNSPNTLYSGLVSNVQSNLSYTPTTGIVANTDGTGFTIPLATTTTRGLMDDVQFDKLGFITVSQAVDLDTMESNIASNNAKVSNVSTNLGYTPSSRTITSSDGNNAVITEVVASGNSGLMTGADKALLDSYDIPAIISNGIIPSLNTGITGAEVRSLIGAGTTSTTGTIESISSGNGMNFTTITSSGAVTLATPSTNLSATSTNSVTATSHSHAIDSTIARTASPTFTGTVSIPTLAVTGSVSGNLTVGGNLIVNGTTTTVNSAILTINDNIIVLNNNEAGTPSQNAGVEVERGTSANVRLQWNEGTDSWEATNDGTNYFRLLTTNDTGAGNSLDADTLDGQHGSFYQAWANVTGKPDPVITLGGDLSGSVTLTDLTSGTLTATVANDSHSHSNYALTAGDTFTGDIVIANAEPILTLSDTTNGSGGGYIGYISYVSTSSESFRIGDWAAVNETDGPDILRLDNMNGGEITLQFSGTEAMNVRPAGTNITGNLTLSGTVDGRDVATDGTKLDGIAANANNYIHPSYSTTNINTSGIAIVDSITTTSEGHISAMSTRTLQSATTGQQGVTQLNNTVSSTSTTQAATANAVKLAYDRASMSSFNVQANGGTQIAVTNAEELNFINGTNTSVTITNQTNPTVQVNVTGTVPSATTASNITINSFDTGDTNMPLLLTANSTAGSKPVYEDSALYFNSTSNILYTPRVISNSNIMIDGTAPYLEIDSSDGGTADLYLRNTEGGVRMYADAADLYIAQTGVDSNTVQDNWIRCLNNSSVSLYHNNAIKIATASGGVTVTGVVNATSDERLKENIVTYNGTDAMTIRAVDFEWKDKTNGADSVTGYIAQEVEKTMPEAITEDDEGIKSVNYNAVHTAKIAELEEIVKSQASDIERLLRANEEQVKRLLKLLEEKG